MMKPWEQTPILIKRTEAKLFSPHGPEWRVEALYRIGEKEYPTRVTLLGWHLQDMADNGFSVEAFIVDQELRQLAKFIPTDPKILARRRKAVHGIRGRHQKRHCSNCLQK